jgi:hypothetical protein
MILYYCVRVVPTPSGTVETYLISAPEPQHLREADTLTGSFPADVPAARMPQSDPREAVRQAHRIGIERGWLHACDQQDEYPTLPDAVSP